MSDDIDIPDGGADPSPSGVSSDGKPLAVAAVYSIRLTLRGEADAPTLEAVENAAAAAVAGLVTDAEVTVKAHAERVD